MKTLSHIVIGTVVRLVGLSIAAIRTLRTAAVSVRAFRQLLSEVRPILGAAARKRRATVKFTIAELSVEDSGRALDAVEPESSSDPVGSVQNED